MGIAFDPVKEVRNVAKHGISLARAEEMDVSAALIREDDRFDYGEPRFITAGWLEAKLVVLVWTPRGSARRIISMRHCHEREAQKLRPHLTEP